MHDLQEGGKIMARLQCLDSHRIIDYNSINSLGGETICSVCRHDSGDRGQNFGRR